MTVNGISHPVRKKTAILQIAPETGRLPRDMGPLAAYISGKSGGMGEVVSALCEGLTDRGFECHLATLNLSRRFQQENDLNDDQWRRPANGRSSGSCGKPGRNIIRRRWLTDTSSCMKY